VDVAVGIGVGVKISLAVPGRAWLCLAVPGCALLLVAAVPSNKCLHGTSLGMHGT